MTVVIGTAGHIDHGKTTLLRVLTGIDADRLPEEQRRGMTIDVGYAHLVTPDGREVDFVDVPGHDRLVGNMLVGAGEIDAAMLVVAADDGPRPQTLEHLALLDGLGITDGLAVVTKTDLVGAGRRADVLAQVHALLAPTNLARSTVMAVSSVSGDGLDELRAILLGLAERVALRRMPGHGPRLSVDRAFSIRGRGLVVTGSLRGGPLRVGEHLRLVPGDRAIRVRELQVHGRTVVTAAEGRTALNLGGVEVADVARGNVLTTDPAVVTTDRLLVALAPPRLTEATRRPASWPPRDRASARLHLGTDDVEAVLGRAGRDAMELPDGRAVAALRLARSVAAAAGDRFVLRWPSPGSLLAGGVVIDALPVRGPARRRQTPERVAAVADAVAGGAPDRVAAEAALLVLHGATTDAGRSPRLAPDVLASAVSTAVEAVEAWHAGHAADPGAPLPGVRAAVERALRRSVAMSRESTPALVDLVITAAIDERTLVRDGDRLRRPGHRPAGPDAGLLAAMDRLEVALRGNTPPALAATAAGVGCPPEGVRALEQAGRIVVLEPDLAWAASSYRELAAQALVMATHAPLTPAAYRDATGTSRRYCLAILEDLDRRGVLRRTEAGHVAGPKAPSR